VCVCVCACVCVGVCACVCVCVCVCVSMCACAISATNMIFCDHQLIEKAIEHDTKSFFIDLRHMI